MRYEKYEVAFSPARLNKYRIACGVDTGRTGTFPSTIALNKFYYFMPYFKGKGVRDIYLIRIARIGTKAEVRPESEDHEPRILFDLEYVGSLSDYQDIKLTKYFYRDTVLGRILK